MGVGSEVYAKRTKWDNISLALSNGSDPDNNEYGVKKGVNKLDADFLTGIRQRMLIILKALKFKSVFTFGRNNAKFFIPCIKPQKVIVSPIQISRICITCITTPHSKRVLPILSGSNHTKQLIHAIRCQINAPRVPCIRYLVQSQGQQPDTSHAARYPIPRLAHANIAETTEKIPKPKTHNLSNDNREQHQTRYGKTTCLHGTLCTHSHPTPLQKYLKLLYQ
jgi:hypothetical protein